MNNYILYVTEDIAKKAMEKGFDCSKHTAVLIGPSFKLDNNKWCVCPTAEQICGWLEDKFHILPLSILRYEGNSICWTPQIMRTLYDGSDEFKSVNDDLDEFDFQTRQEALFKAIDKALDLI